MYVATWAATKSGAAVWIKRNEHNVVIDKVVAKENRSRTLVDWGSIPRADVDTPLELFLHRRLTQLPRATMIVRLRSDKVFEDHCMYRTYTEFCTRGDLEDMIRLHVDAQGQ